MSSFEFEFNQQDKDLVVSQDAGTFGGTDYIRLTIYPQEAIENIVTLPNTNEQAIFYSSLTNNVLIDISPFGAGIGSQTFRNVGVKINPDTNQPYNDFQIYQNGDDIYIKPNEIFNKFELPEGDYRIQIDFLNQFSFGDSFVIKQISTSRKEIRLKALNFKIDTNSSITPTLINTLNEGTEKYQFRHVLNIGNGDHIPIMNYAFDKVTDGVDNQSIILKLYEPLPTNIVNLSFITIEKEVLTTQLQDIFYFSDVPDVFFGDGLLSDPQQNWINPTNNNIGFENLNQLAYSASIDDIEINSLISQSQYELPNLNTNYNEFENHTFFGSAKKKLQNFNKKVKTIQGHYSDISESLNSEGGAIGGDSVFLIQKRKDLFKKINNEINSFTPYERFLYFDGQSESTASAPGLGRNYAHSTPLNKGSNFEQLNQTDGFKVVYKKSNSGDINSNIILFDDKYKVQDKPFFNYSSSIYLSFLMKGSSGLTINRDIDNHKGSGFDKNKFYLPYEAMHTGSTLQPSVTGSEYRRFIFEASSSYFVPNTAENDMAGLTIDDFKAGSSAITILHTNIKTGSSLIKDSTNQYPTTAVSESSGIPFKGSIMPAGDLFILNYTSGSALTQSFITDVKVTLNDPSDVLPFDNIYHTSSTNYTTWYNDMLTKAENFDTDNIHSFENNLPLYIQESSDFNDMKDFLNLQGEQYDVIRNHIDSLGTLHKRGYEKTDSPPDNTLPVLLSNMGWEAINPFSGSLSETLGSFLRGVTSIDSVKNNIWRKNLNNLINVYKTKGTTNSVRALLNIHGFPPDVLQFKEFGGSTEESNPRIFTNNPPTTGVDLSLDTETGSFSFTSNKRKLYNYKFNGDSGRVLQFDWYYNDANINTIEFVYKHVESTNEQLILVSRANALFDQNNWDLRVVPSSDGASSSFEFRLNNSNTGSLPIASNALSMSTDFSSVRNGQLWNIMLQRMTASSDSTIGNEYRLHAALQEDNTIKTYNYVTMSINGAESVTNNRANQNFIGTGSRAAGVAGNLHVGGKLPTTIYDLGLTGSISEIKAWSTPLSTSKFRQHVLNKFSTVGNTINSHREELIYHFKLNENFTTSSISSSAQTLTFVDASPTTTYSDYSLRLSNTSGLRGIITSSMVYGFDIINSAMLTLQDNSQKRNDKSVVINVEKTPINNLDAYEPAVESLTNPTGKKPKIITSNVLEIYRSPQDHINNFILDNVSGYNLERLYGNPIEFYSQSYGELDTFRENFFDSHPVSVDVNKFIRAHESMFSYQLGELLKRVVPARATFSDIKQNVGVEIKPTILEKQKYENEKHSVEPNPNTTSASISPSPSLSNSEFVQPKSGSVSISVTNVSTYEQPKSASISVNVTNTTTYERPKSGSINSLPLLNSSTYETSKDGTIDYASDNNKSFVNIHNNWGTSSADTHFIHYNRENKFGIKGGTGSRGDYNVGHIDTRFHFYAIGDSEYYSASRGKSSNFEDDSKFYNRVMLDSDFHSDITYESLIHGSVGGQSGRMMGKTRYFITSSNGEITLPRNHVTKFSYPFKEQMINGAQNTNPGFLNVRYEDYSSASFYRVKVTGGQNQIRVQSGTPGLAADDKIIYDDNSGGGGAL